MKLELGKRYVTRDGRVTSPLSHFDQEGALYPYCARIDGELDEDYWQADGAYLYDGRAYKFDLVREYVDTDPFPVASRLDQVMDEVRAERASQDAKWGEQNHEPYQWLSILMEEVGEAAQAANDSRDMRKTLAEQAYKQEQYRAELIQVAAVAIAMIESLDRNGK